MSLILHFLFFLLVALHREVAHGSLFSSSVLFVSGTPLGLGEETRFVSTVVGRERSASAGHEFTVDTTASTPIPPPPSGIGGHLAIFVYGDMKREEIVSLTEKEREGTPSASSTSVVHMLSKDEEDDDDDDYDTVATTSRDKSLLLSVSSFSSSSAGRAEAPPTSLPVHSINTMLSKRGAMSYADSRDADDADDGALNSEKSNAYDSFPLNPPPPPLHSGGEGAKAERFTTLDSSSVLSASFYSTEQKREEVAASPSSSRADENDDEEESTSNTEEPLTPAVPSIATSPLPSSAPTSPSTLSPSPSSSSLTPSFSSSSISNFIRSCIRRVAHVFRHLTNAEHVEVMAAETKSKEIQQADNDDAAARGGGGVGRPLPVVAATRKNNKSSKGEQRRSSSSGSAHDNSEKKKGKQHTKKSIMQKSAATTKRGTKGTTNMFEEEQQQKTDDKTKSNSKKALPTSVARSDGGVLGIRDVIIRKAEDAAEYLLGEGEEGAGQKEGSGKRKAIDPEEEEEEEGVAALDFFSSSARSSGEKGAKGSMSAANDRETESTSIDDRHDKNNKSLRRHRLMVLLTLVILFFLGSCVGTAIFFCVCLKLRNRWRKGKKKPNGRGYYGIDDDDDYDYDDDHMYATPDGQELAALSSRGSGGAGAAAGGYGATDDRRKLPSRGGEGGGIITLLGNKTNSTDSYYHHRAHHNRTLSTNSRASSSHNKVSVAARRTPLHRHRDSLGDGGTSTLYVYRDGSNADVKEGEGGMQGVAAIWSLSSSTSGMHNQQHIVGDTTLQCHEPQIMSALPPRLTSSPLLGAMGSRHEIVTSPHGGPVDLGPVRGTKPRVHGGGMMLGGTYGANSGLDADEGPRPLMFDPDNSNAGRAGERPLSLPAAGRDEEKPKFASPSPVAAAGLSSGSNMSSFAQSGVSMSERSKMNDDSSSSDVISNHTYSSSAGGGGGGGEGKDTYHGADNKGTKDLSSAGGSVNKRQQFRAAKGLK